MFIDSHTHQISSETNISIVNIYPDNIDFELYQRISCGIHPWFIDGDKIDSWLKTIEDLCVQKKIMAIGECGLDKNIANLDCQKEIFEAQIKLSEQYLLPCILHSVKTHHLILEIRNSSNAKQPWIIHGFNGSIETAQQFASQNIFISFGENLIKHPDKFKKLLNQVDMDFVLLETDDSDVTIVEVYHQVAKLLNIELAWLENKIEMNFNRFFGR